MYIYIKKDYKADVIKCNIWENLNEGHKELPSTIFATLSLTYFKIK